MIEIAILLVLLLLNGIFAMGEIAMVSSRKSRLEERAKRGNPGAKAALILLAHPERLLSTVQVGITSIGTVAGAFGGIAIAGNFAKYLVALSVTPAVAEPVSMVVVVGSITFLSLVFGELVPKSIALNNPEPVAMVAAPILVVVATITQPLVRFLAWITSAVLRMLGISNKRAVPVSEAEFKLMIDEGVHHGVIEHQESEMLKGIFRFDDRKAQSLMTHRQHLAWIDIKDSPRQIRAQILESEYTKFLVCEEQLAFFLWSLLALVSFFVVTDKVSAAVMASLIGINVFVFGVALGAVTVQLFPREKLGQFCSAQAFFYQTIIMVLSPLLVAPFFDWLKFNRGAYLWSSFFYLLAGIVTVKVYHNWKRKQEIERE